MGETKSCFSSALHSSPVASENRHNNIKISSCKSQCSYIKIKSLCLEYNLKSVLKSIHAKVKTSKRSSSPTQLQFMMFNTSHESLCKQVLEFTPSVLLSLPVLLYFSSLFILLFWHIVTSITQHSGEQHETERRIGSRTCNKSKICTAEDASSLFTLVDVLN